MTGILAPLLKQSKSFPLSLVAHPLRASCDARAVRDNRRMNDTDKKKAKVTPEQVEECRKLRELYDQRIAKIGKKNMPSQERIGEDYGIGSQSMVGHFLGGRSALTLDAAVSFSRLLECDVADFSPRLAAKQHELTLAAKEPIAGQGSTASDVAEAIRLSIQAIAEKWGIKDARDLLDTSEEAVARVEQAISLAFVSKSDKHHSNRVTKATDTPSTTRDNAEGPRDARWEQDNKKTAANGNNGGSGGTT